MKSKVKNITFATFYSCNFANLAESVISQGLSLEEEMASKGRKNNVLFVCSFYATEIKTDGEVKLIFR